MHRKRATSDAEAIRALALSLPESYEDSPWGFPVFKVADNRMFTSMVVEPNAVQVTVKLTPEEREVAQLLPFARRASYVGRYGWVTVTVTDEETLETALDWVRESYWLRAPARLRRAAEAGTDVDQPATGRGAAARGRGGRRSPRSGGGNRPPRRPHPPA